VREVAGELPPEAMLETLEELLAESSSWSPPRPWGVRTGSQVLPHLGQSSRRRRRLPAPPDRRSDAPRRRAADPLPPPGPAPCCRVAGPSAGEAPRSGVHAPSLAHCGPGRRYLRL